VTGGNGTSESPTRSPTSMVWRGSGRRSVRIRNSSRKHHRGPGGNSPRGIRARLRSDRGRLFAFNGVLMAATIPINHLTSYRATRCCLCRRCSGVDWTERRCPQISPSRTRPLRRRRLCKCSQVRRRAPGWNAGRSECVRPADRQSRGFGDLGGLAGITAARSQIPPPTRPSRGPVGRGHGGLVGYNGADATIAAARPMAT